MGTQKPTNRAARTQAQSPVAVLRTRKLELVDAEGRTRALLVADPGEVKLGLFDVAGDLRAELAVTDQSGPILVFMDARGLIRRALSLSAEGELEETEHHYSPSVERGAGR